MIVVKKIKQTIASALVFAALLGTQAMATQSNTTTQKNPEILSQRQDLSTVKNPVLFSATNDQGYVRGSYFNYNGNAVFFDVDELGIFTFPMSKAILTLQQGKSLVFLMPKAGQYGNHKVKGYDMNKLLKQIPLLLGAARMKAKTGNIYFLAMDRNQESILTSQLKFTKYVSSKTNKITKTSTLTNNQSSQMTEEEMLKLAMEMSMGNLEENENSNEKPDLSNQLKKIQQTKHSKTNPKYITKPPIITDNNNSQETEDIKEMQEEEEFQSEESIEILSKKLWEANKKSIQWVDMKTLMDNTLAKKTPKGMAMFIGNPKNNYEEVYVILPGFMMNIKDVKIYMKNLLTWITDKRKSSAIVVFQTGDRGDGIENVSANTYLTETVQLFTNTLIPYAQKNNMQLNVMGHSRGALLLDLSLKMLQNKNSLPKNTKLALINPMHVLKQLPLLGMQTGANLQPEQMSQLNKFGLGKMFSVSSNNPKNLHPKPLKALMGLLELAKLESLYTEHVCVIDHMQDTVVKAYRACKFAPKTRGIHRLKCGGNAHMCVGCPNTLQGLGEFFDALNGQKWVLQHTCPQIQEQDECRIM